MGIRKLVTIDVRCDAEGCQAKNEFSEDTLDDCYFVAATRGWQCQARAAKLEEQVWKCPICSAGGAPLPEAVSTLKARLEAHIAKQLDSFIDNAVVDQMVLANVRHAIANILQAEQELSDTPVGFAVAPDYRDPTRIVIRIFNKDTGEQIL